MKTLKQYLLAMATSLIIAIPAVSFSASEPSAQPTLTKGTLDSISMTSEDEDGECYIYVHIWRFPTPC